MNVNHCLLHYERKAHPEANIWAHSPNIVRVIKSRRLRWQIMWPQRRKVGFLSKFEQVRLQERNF